MMRKILLLLILCAFACNNKDTKNDVIETGITTAKDTSKSIAPKVGTDEDLHGCKTSAGYTWSALKGECVRVFEAGTLLTPYNDPTGAQMSAFVIFKGDKAELFIQTEKPLVLQRKAEGEPFTDGVWQLIPWKGYVLKKNGTILYTGK
jgi:hypothetical protein